MIEELIKLLRKLESEAEEILSDLHHLRAVIADYEESDESLDAIYVLKILDRVIEKVGVCP